MLSTFYVWMFIKQCTISSDLQSDKVKHSITCIDRKFCNHFVINHAGSILWWYTFTIKWNFAEHLTDRTMWMGSPSTLPPPLHYSSESHTLTPSLFYLNACRQVLNLERKSSGHTDLGPLFPLCPYTWLKGKFPQTTMWIGWVESNFTNPTVKV